MSVSIDTHDVQPLRLRFERQSITKKSYLDTIQVSNYDNFGTAGNVIETSQNGDYYPPEGCCTFWDERAKKLYVIGGKQKFSHLSFVFVMSRWALQQPKDIWTFERIV